MGRREVVPRALDSRDRVAVGGDEAGERGSGEHDAHRQDGEPGSASGALGELEPLVRERDGRADRGEDRGRDADGLRGLTERVAQCAGVVPRRVHVQEGRAEDERDDSDCCEREQQA